MMKLFWGSRELNVVTHTFGPNRPSKHYQPLLVDVLVVWSTYSLLIACHELLLLPSLIGL